MAKLLSYFSISILYVLLYQARDRVSSFCCFPLENPDTRLVLSRLLYIQNYYSLPDTHTRAHGQREKGGDRGRGDPANPLGFI